MPSEPELDARARLAPAGAAEPDRATFRTGVAPWLGVVAAATVILALRPPAVIAAVVLLAAMAAVTERVVRHRRRGLLDAVLIGAGGALSATGLLAYLLAVSPIGLAPTSLLVGLAAMGVVAVLCCAGRPVPPSPVAGYLAATGRALSLGTILILVASAVIVGAALALSLASSNASQTAPLAIAVSADDQGAPGLAAIEITAGTTTGPLTVQAVTGSQVTVLDTGVTVDPGHPYRTLVSLTPGTQTTVALLAAGSTDPVRELVLAAGPDDRNSSGGGP